jgi:hypothetical protein
MRISLFFSTVTAVSLLAAGLLSPVVSAAESSVNTGSSRMKITVPQKTVPAGELATITLLPNMDAVCSGKILVGENTYVLTEQTVKKNVAVAWGFTPGTSDNGKAKVYIKCGKEKGVASFLVGTGKPSQPSTDKPPATSPDCTEKTTSCDPAATTNPDCVKQNTECNPTTPSTDCVKQNTECNPTAPSTDCVKQNTECSPEQTSSSSDKTYASTLFTKYPNLSSRFTAEKIASLGRKACSAFASGESVESVHKMYAGSGYFSVEETKAVIYTAAVIFCPTYKEAVVKAYGIG